MNLEGEGVEIRPALYLRSEEAIQILDQNGLSLSGVPILKLTDCSSLAEALKTSAERGWTHLIVLNDFAQNFSEQWGELKSLILKKPWHIHSLGEDKKSKSSNHPLVQRLFDIGDKDFREYRSENWVYPVFLVQDFIDTRSDSFISDRILIDSIRKGRRLDKVGMDIKKVPPKKTLMQKYWNSHYEALLVALTSFENGSRPLHSALSFGMGVFLACSPFYGMQTFLIIVAAVVFRLSFPVAFLGSQVSLPPIYSLIVPLELLVGFRLTNKPFDFDGPLLETARNHFLSWLIGATLVGAVLAVLLGGLWYLFQKNHGKKSAAWNGQMRGGRFGNALMFRLIRLGGLPLAYFLLYFIVPYFYLFAPSARKALSQYYKIVKPETGWLGRQVLIIRHLNCFAQTIVDQAYQAAHSELKFDITYDSGESLKPGHSRGAGVMLFSHFGGWGLATQGFSRRQTSKKVHVIKYVSEKLTSEKIFKEKEMDHLVKIPIRPGEPVFMALHGILGEEQQLAIMGDRPFDNNFELLPFMGRLAPVPSTPFRLAKTYKAELSFILGFKKSMRKYGLVTEAHGMEDLDIKSAMSLYLRFLEKGMKLYPSQWFNHYLYWSTLPTRPDGSLCEPSRYHLAESGL